MISKPHMFLLWRLSWPRPPGWEHRFFAESPKLLLYFRELPLKLIKTYPGDNNVTLVHYT